MLIFDNSKSPSMWIKSKIKGDWDFSESPAKQDDTEIMKFRLRRGLHQLARVVNLVENAQAYGKERNLALKWSDGTAINHPGTRYVALDPIEFLQSKNETQALDKMTGQALMASSMKRTMDMNAFLDYINTSQSCDRNEGEKYAKHLFEARESARARTAVLNEWAGFRPYFEIHQALSGGAKREEVENLALGQMTPEVFAAVASWNILFPEQRVNLPDPVLNAALPKIEAMSMTDDPTINSFRHQVNVGWAISDLFEVQPENDENKDDEESGDGGGGASENGDDSGDGESPRETSEQEGGPEPAPQQSGGEDGSQNGTPDLSNFSLADPNLFGSHIDGTAAHQAEVDLNDQMLSQLRPESNVDYYPDSTVPLLSLGLSRVRTNDPTAYKTIATSVRSLTDAIRKNLSFQKVKQESWIHGLEEGDLDAGSYHKIAQGSSHLFSQKKIANKSDVAITLLIDMSGSMEGPLIASARDLAVALTEALKDLPGVHLSVAGHTAGVSNVGPHADILQEGSTVHYVDYYGKHHSNPYAISMMRAYNTNYDGYAIECAARKMVTDFPTARRKIVFVLSDGRPCNGTIHVRGCVNTAKSRMGVDVYGIGINNAYTEDDGIAMYGEGKSVVIRDVLGAAGVISPFLKRVLSQLR